MYKKHNKRYCLASREDWALLSAFTYSYLKPNKPQAAGQGYPRKEAEAFRQEFKISPSSLT